ncbi:MAG: NADP-dependent phosphogluconate dehydrogenase [Mucilaginibacter polytrichastri]|nr:NADP-dependent phosphogluconate dehydrogenase [Mucilaginibacter polytrichastri]
MSTIPDKYKFGMIGLGVMGRNLLLNMADHDVSIAGYDKDKEKGLLLEKEANGKPAKGFTALSDFVQSLQTPRAIMLLVPAGKPVDDVIGDLLPLLDKGDLIIDGGNSHFTDTNRRVEFLGEKGLHFFGMGVSGGEEGARRGPSMMPGGDKNAYEVVRSVFESIAAKVNGEPCVTYIGPGASGHFTKMVHNGIEYGLMQLIAETYGVMKTGLNMDNAAIGEVFAKWNDGRLKSFLMDITKDIFVYKEPGADHLLLDDIKDEARSKGTGKWTSQAAMDLQAPVGTIDTAVSLRDLSKYKAMREQAATLYPAPEAISGDRDALLKALEEAFYFAMIVTYAQGMHMLSRASDEYGYELKLNEIAKIWRGGCIIRSEFLSDIYNAYTKDAQLGHLLLDKQVAELVSAALPGTREVVSKAISAGIAIPAYAASLSYFDAFRTGRLPSNLIQAQRDYFGSHTYELIGKEGVFHTKWTGKTV